ncbi:MAG: HNH endonuclease, partial [Spirochaetia bacterium]|nr:HNH endonuclease [Spirochaetia bacterium]
FEVFKRDLFTCQYCGKKAPEAILEIDHIIPVSKGGDNSIENLVAACRECNGGKSNKKLSELSEVEKSRRQLEDLQEKKNMTDMILQWKSGLSDTLTYQVEQIEQLFFAESPEIDEVFSEKTRRDFRKIIRKYGFEEVLEALYISIENYDFGTRSGRLEALKKISGIAHNRHIEATDPDRASFNKVMHVACKHLRMEPAEFYRALPISLYRSKDEKQIIDAILTADYQSKFKEMINQIYFGGNNG